MDVSDLQSVPWEQLSTRTDLSTARNHFMSTVFDLYAYIHTNIVFLKIGKLNERPHFFSLERYALRRCMRSVHMEIDFLATVVLVVTP